MWVSHRIIDDRIEKYESYIVFFSKKDCRNEECLSRQEINTKGGWGRHPQTTYVPHARPGVGNGGGRRVRQGSTSPAPLPIDSTPTQSEVGFLKLKKY